uniref:Uncharacterized protein n=1 Tax=Glossina austeni TaxID=7395 RepID=A0A1A9UG12_GLOAU
MQLYVIENSMLSFRSAGGIPTSAALADRRSNHMKLQHYILRALSESVDEKILKNLGIKVEANFDSRINDLKVAMKMMKSLPYTGFDWFRDRVEELVMSKTLAYLEILLPALAPSSMTAPFKPINSKRRLLYVVVVYSIFSILFVQIFDISHGLTMLALEIYSAVYQPEFCVDPCKYDTKRSFVLQYKCKHTHPSDRRFT